MVHDLVGATFVEQVDRFHVDKRSFYLSPSRWRMSRVGVPLSWNEVRFEPGNRDQVPKQKGVYAFIVRHRNNHFPDHGFIMYIGITGHKAKERTLHDRYYEYMREKERNKRPRVHYMLNKYGSDLFFNYVPLINLAGPALEQLEKDLNDALIPPVGRNDYSVEIKRLREALA